MSKQWIIEDETGAELTVRAPNGFAVELDANSADPRERFAYFAIRQQARDIESLRAELAAAVAERDRLFLAQAGNLDTFMRVKLRAEQAEARIVELEAAPVVAYVNSLSQHAVNYLVAEFLPPQDQPPIGTELIARPTKAAVDKAVPPLDVVWLAERERLAQRVKDSTTKD